MSRHGDNNEFMNELSDALESRAKEVGARKAMQEVADFNDIVIPLLVYL